MYWSIHNNIPLGITAHLIDKNIDAGKILERKIISLYKDDTIFDLSERLYEVQLDMIDSSIKMAQSGQGSLLQNESAYNRKMEESMELQILSKIPAYLNAQIEQKNIAG